MWECPLVGVPITSHISHSIDASQAGCDLHFVYICWLMLRCTAAQVSHDCAILGASRATWWPARGPRGSFETHECNYCTPGRALMVSQHTRLSAAVDSCSSPRCPPTDPQTHFSNWLWALSHSLPIGRWRFVNRRIARGAEPLPVTCRDEATTPLFIYISLRCSFSLELAQTNVRVVGLCRRREAKDKD